MIVIEPGDYERGNQLLPGSPEREAALVPSLAELKAQMEKDNADKARKTRFLNKAIVATSILAVVGLFLTDRKIEKDIAKHEKAGEMLSPKGQNRLTFWKILKFFGTVLSIGAFFNGVNNISNNITVVEPKNEDKNYALIRINDNDRSSDKLRDLTTKAVLDTLISMKVVSKSKVRNRIKAIRSNRSSVKNKAILNSILKYEPGR